MVSSGTPGALLSFLGGMKRNLMVSSWKKRTLSIHRYFSPSSISTPMSINTEDSGRIQEPSIASQMSEKLRRKNGDRLQQGGSRF